LYAARDHRSGAHRLGARQIDGLSALARVARVVYSAIHLGGSLLDSGCMAADSDARSGSHIRERSPTPCAGGISCVCAPLVLAGRPGVFGSRVDTLAHACEARTVKAPSQRFSSRPSTELSPQSKTADSEPSETWLRNHEPKYHHDCRKRRDAQPEPKARIRTISRRHKVSAFSLGCASQIAHPNLQPYNRNPAGSRQDE